jgi:hypothetical protein
LNQQRQTITETRYPIDQTIPHQLVVSKILGALMCHPTLRIIQKPRGERPYCTPSDPLADRRGTCDLALSLDGSMNYAVVAEVKTTTIPKTNAWRLFKDVREMHNNREQFTNLVSAAPRWWYVIVCIDKLTAKTLGEHDRNLLDCPAILVEGKHGDQVPDEIFGFINLGDMMQVFVDRLNIFTSASTEQPRSAQYDLLMDESPEDDVQAVTMDTPLKVMVSNKPTPAPHVETPITPIENPRSLPSESIQDMLIGLSSVGISVDEIKSRMREDELSAHDEIIEIISNHGDLLERTNKIRSLAGMKQRRRGSIDTFDILKSELAVLSLAVSVCRLRYKSDNGFFATDRHRSVFREFYFSTPHMQSKNIANMIAHRFFQESS